MTKKSEPDESEERDARDLAIAREMIAEALRLLSSTVPTATLCAALAEAISRIGIEMMLAELRSHGTTTRTLVALQDLMRGIVEAFERGAAMAMGEARGRVN